MIATVGAFFVTTRLKRAPPVVERLTFARHLSPNADGRKDSVAIGFSTRREDEVTVSLISEDGDEVAVLASDRELNAGRHRFTWSGRLEGGGRAPDGEYRVRIGLRSQGRSVTSRRKVFVDTVPPRPVVRYVSPTFISPDGVGRAETATLRFDGPTRSPPELLVYRTDTRRPRLVARRPGRRGAKTLSWDGRVGARPGRPAATGNYVLVVRATDAAGNVGPARLPPRRGQLEGHPGVVVRYLAARGPLVPVNAGSIVRFAVASDGRRYRWRVRRLGSRRSLDRGSSRASALSVRAPRGRAGVFLLELRVGGRRYVTPFAVRSTRPRRVLVVLPATTWQARNDVDTDGDGFGDVLPSDPSVPARRAFGGDGLPSGFTAREAPLLLFLDRERLRYDVTTDLAIARDRARPFIRYGGALVAGAPLFAPAEATRALRSYVESGGRVAWLGTGGFTRAVRLRGDELRYAGGSPRRNSFGERLASGRESELLTVLSDRIAFFRGVGGAFGPFPAIEESRSLPANARSIASAGHEADRPSVIVYRLRQGVVARLGADGFARAAVDSPDVARIMRRLWTLLSR